MYVATRANVRVTYMAATERESTKLSEAFKVAFKGGCVMGFCLVSLALAVLTVLIYIYQSKFFFNRESVVNACWKRRIFTLI